MTPGPVSLVEAGPFVVPGAVATIERMSERWHPILAAKEGPVGTWRMVDPVGINYATIELRRLDGTPRYRVTMADEVVGYASSLKIACERAQRIYVANHGHHGPPNGRF